jgi:ATP-dependent exoDNAse (exonuclease V) alpha subunit
MTQQEALDILKMGQNVFLTGSPGSGKTFLLNKYIEYLKEHNKVVAVTASTGIAATHMNGVTLHSWSGLGIKETVSDKDIKALMKRKYLFKRIRAAKVLIIDEVSMLKASQLDAVDKICQYFKASFLPFGGMQVVLSGDFFQLPPIERSGREVNFIVESAAWKTMDIKTCYLEGQFRHKDKKLSLLLDSIRENNIEESKNILGITEDSNAEFLFENILENNIIPTKLYTHNTDVDKINDFQLSKINQKEFAYQMLASGPKDIITSLKKSCLAPEKLVLKQGAQVMFIKNNFEQGYVNGTQGRVVGFDAMSMPMIETVSGKIITARQASWTIDEEGGALAQIHQLPLRLAWAITVHKSQGMNLDTAEIDLSRCFVRGMGYVALSRLISFAGLRLVGINDLAFYVNEKAVEMDVEFKAMSKRVMAHVKKMSPATIKKEQERFVS